MADERTRALHAAEEAAFWAESLEAELDALDALGAAALLHRERARGLAEEHADAEIALVKNAIDTLRSGGASSPRRRRSRSLGAGVSYGKPPDNI